VILLTRPTLIYQGVSVSLSLTQRAWNRAQYGVMGSSRICDGNFVAVESYPTLAFDEVAVGLRYVATFKPAEFSGQHAVKRIGDHGHDDIKVHPEKRWFGKLGV